MSQEQPEALAQIAAWRTGMGGESPETEEQREMVQGWRVGNGDWGMINCE